MCGRYTHKEKSAQLLELLKVIAVHLDTKPRYNVAPSQMVACVRNAPENGHREAVMLKWGLIPSWAKEPSIGYKMINARAETVAEKPSFRKAFKRQRCLILADGFYEWKREGKAKQPYYIRLKDSRLFAFAGLWERWKDKTSEDNHPIESCTIITTTANELMASIHQRMPVILHEQDFDVWLDAHIQDSTILNALLRPYEPEELETYPVSTLVNSPANNLPQCIDPM